MIFVSKGEGPGNRAFSFCVRRNIMNHKIPPRTALSAAAVAGVVGVGVSGYFAGKKAQQIFTFQEENLGRELTKRERVLYAAKVAWPVALLAVSTGGAIIGANKLATKDIQKLTIAYTTTASLLEAHQKTELVKLGKETYDEIKEDVGKDCQLPERTVLNTSARSSKTRGVDDYLCFDDYSGRYFWSNESKIETAFVKLSRLLFESTGNCVIVNDLYDLLDVEETGCGMGWGWDLEFDNENLKEYIRYEVYPSRDPGGTPCLVLTYHPLQVVPF